MRIVRQAASLRHQVEEVIRAAIISGEFPPGARLVEQQLCQRLDVSRALLRESMRQLEAEGLVEIVPHRGVVVATVGADEARQIYEVRAVLEALAGRGFAEHASDAEVAQLRSVLAELEQAERRGVAGRSVLSIKQRFYAVLLAGCGNSIVKETLERLNNRVSLLRALSMSRAGRLRNTVAEIRAIVAAIERRDANAAHDACLRHVRNAAENAFDTLAGDGAPASGGARATSGESDEQRTV